MNATTTALIRAISLGLLLLAAPLLSGCQGCGEKPAPKGPDPIAAKAPEKAENPAPKSDQPAIPAKKPAYRGPRSQGTDGYQLTMGLADAEGKPRRQPVAMESTSFYITVLDAKSRPVNQLADVEGQQLRAYLVARDMRQAFYAETAQAISDSADARSVVFKPREGGDHALIAAFAGTDGKRRTVSSPIVIKGALPQVMGPGVEGLSNIAKIPSGTVALQAGDVAVGKPTKLTFVRRDLAGQPSMDTDTRIDSALVYEDEMGAGQWLPRAGNTAFSWTPDKPGTFLLLVVLRERDKSTDKPLPPRPLAFKLEVPAPKEATK